jgi:Lrp/AsnC family leucine-responsive transcriptional regulator
LRPIAWAIGKKSNAVDCPSPCGHYVSGSGTFELQVMTTDLDAFSHLSLDVLMNLPHVKDLHTSFSLGEVKGESALPLQHLDGK